MCRQCNVLTNKWIGLKALRGGENRVMKELLFMGVPVSPFFYLSFSFFPGGRCRWVFATILYAALLTAAPARGKVVTIGLCKDTPLYESPSGSQSDGARIHGHAGTDTTGAIRRALLAFDIPRYIPADCLAINSPEYQEWFWICL